MENNATPAKADPDLVKRYLALTQTDREELLRGAVWNQRITEVLSLLAAGVDIDAVGREFRQE